jgi:hypothetical protein
LIEIGSVSSDKALSIIKQVEDSLLEAKKTVDKSKDFRSFLKQ